LPPRLPRQGGRAGLRPRRVVAPAEQGTGAGRVRAGGRRPRAPGEARAAVLALLRVQRLQRQARRRLGVGQLDFDAPSAGQALRTKPALVGYSQHEGAESAHWGDSKLEIVEGTHPVVYPALGSHANYYTSALHLGRSAAQGVGCDNTNGPSTQLRPEVLLIPTGTGAYLHTYPWLGYLGHWGEQHQGFYNGPTGPNTKLPSAQPITWANAGWHEWSAPVFVDI